MCQELCELSEIELETVAGGQYNPADVIDGGPLPLVPVPPPPGGCGGGGRYDYPNPVEFLF